MSGQSVFMHEERNCDGSLSFSARSPTRLCHSRKPAPRKKRTTPTITAAWRHPRHSTLETLGDPLLYIESRSGSTVEEAPTPEPLG